MCSQDRKSTGDAWDCLEFYLKETTDSVEWLWPLLLEQSKVVKETNGLCFNSLVSKQVKKWEADFEMQLRRQSFNPQATFFSKDFCTQQLTWLYTFFLHQFISMVVQLRIFLFSYCQQCKWKKKALLFQVSSVKSQGDFLMRCIKVYRICKLKFKSMYEKYCASLLQGCSLKVSERAEMCKSSIFIWLSPFMAGKVCGWEKECIMKMWAGWKMQMSS